MQSNHQAPLLATTNNNNSNNKNEQQQHKRARDSLALLASTLAIRKISYSSAHFLSSYVGSEGERERTSNNNKKDNVIIYHTFGAFSRCSLSLVAMLRFRLDNIQTVRSHLPLSLSFDAAAAVRSLSSSSWRDQQPFPIGNMQCANRARIPPRLLSLSLPLFLPPLCACLPAHLAGRLLVLASHTHTHTGAHTCKSKTGRLRVARKASAHFIYVACCANYDATVDGDSDVAICATPSFSCPLTVSLCPSLAGVNFRLLFEVVTYFEKLLFDFGFITPAFSIKKEQIPQMGAETKINSKQVERA